MAKPIYSRLKYSMAVAVLALISATPIHAAEIVPQKPAIKPMAVAFDWYANGVKNASVIKVQAGVVAIPVINGPGRWICSPAGFGRRSQCYSG